MKRTLKLPLKIVSVETMGVKSLNKDSQMKADMRYINKKRRRRRKRRRGGKGEMVDDD